jgi:hypothetical protein
MSSSSSTITSVANYDSPVGGIRHRVDLPPGKGKPAMTPKGISSLVLSIVLSVVLLQAVGHPEQTAGVEQQVRNMETTRLAFPKDSSRWAEDIADDATFMQGNGVMLNKQQTIENYRNGIETDNSTDLKATEFRQSGDTAIFSYVSTRIRHDDKDRAMRHQHVRTTTR